MTASIVKTAVTRPKNIAARTSSILALFSKKINPPAIPKLDTFLMRALSLLLSAGLRPSSVGLILLADSIKFICLNLYEIYLLQ